MRRQNKYHAIKTEYKGRKYDSKAEAEYAARLDLEVGAGTVMWWIPQVTIPLTEDETYRIDFIVAEPNGGTFKGPAIDVHGIEIKGYPTPAWKKKKKLVDKYCPFPVRVYTKGKCVETLAER